MSIDLIMNELLLKKVQIRRLDLCKTTFPAMHH